MNTEDSVAVEDAIDAQAPAPAVKSPSALDRALNAPRGRPAAPSAPPTAFDHPAPATLPPQALSPAQVTSLPGYGDDAPVAVKAAVEALEALSAATQQVIDARAQLRGNEALTPGAQVLALSDLHSKVSKPATIKLDNAARALQASIAEDARTLNAPMNEGARGPFASELRSVLRSMPVAERMKTIDAAIANGDSTLVGAALGAPPILSGIEPGTVAALAHKWHSSRNPQTVSRLALLRAAEAKLEAAGSNHIANIDAVVGAHHYTVERLRKSKAQVTTVLGAIVPAQG